MLLTKIAFLVHRFRRQWKRVIPSYLVLPYFLGFSVLVYFLEAAGCSVSGFSYDCHVFFQLFCCLPMVLRFPLLGVITVDCRVSVSGGCGWFIVCRLLVVDGRCRQMPLFPLLLPSSSIVIVCRCDQNLR